MFYQIERLRGHRSTRINELILLVAKKNKRQEEHLRNILGDGFTVNGVHYSRFGKSASQGKDGITAFVADNIFDELYMITQMDIEIDECVISKYEAQRCLPFSSSTLIKGYIPNIVIIDEYEKVLENQFIKYVTEKPIEFTDEKTGEIKTYNSREIEEGYHDIKLSPFDGCGCHEKQFMEIVSNELGLDYQAAGVQVRLPFVKGYSAYVPFKAILKEWGYEYITDVYGNRHRVDDIDCIWNVSMFKGHKLFRERYGSSAWNGYLNTLKKYEYCLGISKYSHHVKNLNKYTRMNFQYLQCLNLWNKKYVQHYEQHDLNSYDVLDSQNDGKIVSIAKYTTSLFEKIIKGDKFYTYKFMGIKDTEFYDPDSKYLEAALVNDVMLKDPAVRQFIYRKLQKSINEAKVGKIYCSGFYHTGVGDMIGYLQYAVGQEPVGCLRERELYCGNFSPGECLSFRSPLVDPSEVNKINIVHNGITSRWFSAYKDQDIVMFNMYDISAPQQGGADFDGDIFMLCNDKTLINSKIDKPIILDVEDKITAKSKPYTKENLIEYEVMTRDNRIGEITNCATSIENRYTTNSEVKKMYENDCSLLRILQGKEIDFLKTGTRWQLNRHLRKQSEQLPYFLLYNYPKKMKRHQDIQRKNKTLAEDVPKIKSNAYHSPSPMNELCEYICRWEQKHILWDKKIDDLIDTRCLIINNDLDLLDKGVMKICRKYVNTYAEKLKKYIIRRREGNYGDSSTIDILLESMKSDLISETGLDENIIANYVIKVSYASLSISKAFAWAAYGDYIIENLKNNSNPKRKVTIREVPYMTGTTYEYLGKYYEFEVGDVIV